MTDKDKEFDGYISTIMIDNRIYKLQCEVVEVYPMTCPKCNGPVELKYGHGKCEYCGTNYSTEFKLTEVSG